MNALDKALVYVESRVAMNEPSDHSLEPDMGSTMAAYLQVQATLLLAQELSLLNELLGHPTKGELAVAASPLNRIATSLEVFQSSGLPTNIAR